jgi:hypothetical protein
MLPSECYYVKFSFFYFKKLFWNLGSGSPDYQYGDLSNKHESFFLCHGQFSQNENPREKEGWPAVTSADDLSPWRTLSKEAVVAKAGGELGEVEIFPATINCWFVHHVGIQGSDSHLWQTCPSYSMFIMR